MDWDRECVTTWFMHLSAEVFASPVLKSWFKREDMIFRQILRKNYLIFLIIFNTIIDLFISYSYS